MGVSRTKSRANILLGGAGMDGHDGYAGNGLSIFTRAAARNGRPKFLNATPARLDKGGAKLPVHDLIREYEGRIKWIAAELRTETNAAKRAKLTKNLEIKNRRLADLRASL